MAILDHEIMLEDATLTSDTGAVGALTAARNANGNVYDASAPINLGGAAARRLKPIVWLLAKAGTTPTIGGLFVGSDSPTLASGNVTIWTFPVLADPVTVPQIVHGACPSHTPKRYFGFLWTTTGAGVLFAVKATLVEDDPNSYPT